MHATLRVNAPSVVGEIIDGEAVIMVLTQGHYFSAQGSGAEIWAGVMAQRSRAAIVDQLAARYAHDRGEVAAAVDAFVDELLEHQLVVEDAAGTPPDRPASDSAPPAVDETFVAPVLNSYSDMEDLLLLDPIHDVDATGWPTAKPANKGAA